MGQRIRLFSILFLACAAPFARAAAIFTPLGDLSGGTFLSQPYAISADGTAVTGQSHSTAGYQTFLWTAASGMQGVGPATTNTSAGGVAVANAGAAVFGVDGTNWFRWTASSGVQNLDSGPQTQVGIVYRAGSSPNGTIGVASITGGTGHAVKWSTTAGVQLLPLALVRDMTPDGVTMCGWSNGSLPAIYRAGSGWGGGNDVMEIGDLPGGTTSGSAWDISDDAGVVVGYSGSINGTEAFRWTQTGGMQGLGMLPSTSASYALSTSGDGNVVVGGSSPTGASGTAFIWDAAHGIRSLKSALLNEYGLNIGTWQLLRAEGISSNGYVITGWGTNPSGQSEGWIIALPEPSISIFLLTCALLTCRRRNRSSFGAN